MRPRYKIEAPQFPAFIYRYCIQKGLAIDGCSQVAEITTKMMALIYLALMESARRLRYIELYRTFFFAGYRGFLVRIGKWSELISDW